MQQATQASLHSSQSKHQQQQLQQLLQQQQLQQLQQQLCMQIPGIAAGMSTPSCILISILNIYPCLYIPICNTVGLAGEGVGSTLSQLHGGSDNLSKLKMGDGGGENEGQVHLPCFSSANVLVLLV